MKLFSTTGSLRAVLASLGLHGVLAGLLVGHHTEISPPAWSGNAPPIVDTSVEVDASPEPPAVTPVSPPTEGGPAPNRFPAHRTRAPAEPAPTRAPVEPAPTRAPAEPAPTRATAEPLHARTEARPIAVPASVASASSENAVGAERSLTGVRRLGYAFARAIPAAAPAAATWRDLPLGHVGTIGIEVSVDEGKRLSKARFFTPRLNEPAPPPALEQLVEQVILLLGSGQFVLSSSNQPGVERLLVDVVLRNDRAEEGGADVVVQKRFSGATPARPGTAYFRYGTGQAIEATITVSPAPAIHE